jgi:hypothetical protein
MSAREHIKTNYEDPNAIPLRTYLAGQAMMGIMASPEAPVSDYEGMAIKALKAADALIELLEKKEK